MIIIEGSDLTGKTTFAKLLLEHPALHKAGYIYKHFSRLPHSFDFCFGYVLNASRNSVQDRFHMSEVIYAEVRGEEPGITPEAYRLVDAHLRMIGALTVILTAKEKHIAARFREDEMYSLDDVLIANRLFHARATNDGLFNGYTMDYDIHIHCNDVTPFPDEANVEHVIREYLVRQSQVDCHMKGGNDGPCY